MTRDNFSCDYQLIPVGQFQQGETLVSELFIIQPYYMYIAALDIKTITQYYDY